MAIKWSKGKAFLACTGYPECKNIKDFHRDDSGKIIIDEPEDVGTCPKCGSPLVVKTGRYGRFIACSSYPECDYRAPYVLPFRCPVKGCDGYLTERRSAKGRKYYACTRYPDCKFTTNYEPVAKECPVCGAPTLFKRRNKLVCLSGDCDYKEDLKKTT